jgi:penicillin-binding protein 2
MAMVLGAPRALILGFVVVAVLGGFALRLWQLQFAQGERYRERAEAQRLRKAPIPAPRGIIYDRNGAPLVHNTPSFNVVVTPAYLPDDPAEADAVLVRLAMMLEMPYTTAGLERDGEEAPPGVRDIVREHASVPYHPAVVKAGVDRDVALLVAQEAITLPGVSVEVDRLRDYLHGPLVSQVLGYLLPVPAGESEAYAELGYDPATDRIGVAGVEAVFEEALRGKKGSRLIEEDVLGREVRVIDDSDVPIPGHNVHLTIDLDLQRFAERALMEGMARPIVDSPRGVVIAMDPQTGEVLAMVSLPTYDNNIFVEGISDYDWQRLSQDPHRPLLNHAISDELPPGSVFKIVVASGALQKGTLTPSTRFLCEGTMVVPDKWAPEVAWRAQPFYCWNRAGHGWLDVVGGVAHSCDIFFYKTGGGFDENDYEGLGVAGIAEYAQLFGFGEPTGIELPFDVAGHVPTADWKRLTFGETWTTGDTYNLSIGQGFLTVSPLQMLNAFNVLATGGTLYRPRIVHSVTDYQGNEAQGFEPEIIRDVPVGSEYISLIVQGMEGAVTYGTAPNAQIEGVRVAGKTGTAQFCDNIAQETGICGEGLEQPTHAWFAAFAPIEDPEISIIAFLYNGGEGTVAAAPIAHEIMVHYFGLDDAPGEGGDAGAGAP